VAQEFPSTGSGAEGSAERPRNAGTSFLRMRERVEETESPLGSVSSYKREKMLPKSSRTQGVALFCSD
jgi:hypothetical protein